MSSVQMATNQATDADLIRHTLQGDNAAFGELVRRHQNRLYNTLMRIVGCRTDAEDIVQEAFLRAFVKLKDFRQDCAFYTWLYRLAINLAITHIRMKEPAVSLDAHRESGLCEPADREELPADSLVREERAQSTIAYRRLVDPRHIGRRETRQDAHGTTSVNNTR